MRDKSYGFEMGESAEMIRCWRGSGTEEAEQVVETLGRRESVCM